MSRSIVTTPVDDPVVIIERVFDAPTTLVYRMFTDPFHVVHFFGPHGATNPVCEMDVRPGGIWRQVVRFPDGSEYHITSVYLEVVEHERLVYRNTPDGNMCGADGLPSPLFTTSVFFEDLNGKTRFTAHLRAMSIPARDKAIQSGLAEIMSQGHDRLAAYLTTL